MAVESVQWRIFAFSPANLTNLQGEYYYTELSVCWRYGPASGGKAILKSDQQIFSNRGGGKIPKCDQILGAVALSPPLPGDHVATLPEYGPLSVQAFKI